MNLAHRQSETSHEEEAAPSVMEALHCLRVAITLFDADRHLIYANQHFSYIFRSLPPREELVGRPYEELVRMEITGGDITDPEILGDAEGFVARNTAQMFAGDYAPRYLTLSDGRIIEIKMRRTPEAGWIALWSDVTAARQNLNRLHAAIALSADAFAFYDHNDRLTLCNNEYAVINGASGPQDLAGKTFAEIIRLAAAATITAGPAEEWLRKREQAHRVPAGAMTVELKSGSAYLLRDRSAVDGGRIVVFTDVTEHHRAEKALAEQTRALDDTRRALAVSNAHSAAQANYLADLAVKLDRTVASADTTKRTLLRTMSHELKTPLNAIIGFSDLLNSLADQATPDQIREYAGLIHLGGRNLLRLLNQILDLTKISAGRYELTRQKIDVAGSLWEVRERYDERAYAKEITIETADCEPDLAVSADENAYTTVLNNLVENAVNFTHPGGKVCLAAKKVDGMIRITVSDNGPGIAASELQRILEPFEQGGRSTADHPQGAGLGLTLVKAFSELGGGTLTLKSELGEGFTAVVTIPAVQ